MRRMRGAALATIIAAVLVGPFTSLSGALTLPAATTNASASNTTSIALTVPPGAETNDLLVAQILLVSTGRTVTSGNGYTGPTTDVNGVRQQIWTKVATSSDTAGSTHTWTISGGGSRYAARLILVKGVDSTSAVAGTQAAILDGTTITLPELTGLRANSMLIAAFSHDTTASITNGEGMTEVGTGVSASTNGRIHTFQEVFGAGGSTGTRTGTTAATSQKVGNLLALNPPLIDFTLTSSSGSETVTSVQLEVQLNVAVTLATTVDFTVTGADAADYSPATGTVTIPKGATTATVDLTITDDNLDEGDDAITITLSNPTNAALGPDTVHTYTILDDDPHLTISADPVDNAGGVLTGARWGGWSAQPGDVDVATTNFVKVENTGHNPTQPFVVDFDPDFLGVTDPASTLAIDNNIRFAYWEDTSPGVTSPSEGLPFTYGSVSASGSLSGSFTALGSIIYVQYRLELIPDAMDQDYQASFTVTET